MNKLRINNETVTVASSYDEAKLILAKEGKTALYEFGDSLSPIINSGEYSFITKINSLDDIKIGDCVFCHVPNIGDMIHMVLMKSDSSAKTPFFLIGSSSYQLYGWTDMIYGKVKGTNIYVSNKENI